MLARAALPRMRAMRSIPSSACVRSALEIFPCLAVNSTSMVSLRSLFSQPGFFRLVRFGLYRISVTGSLRITSFAAFHLLDQCLDALVGTA